MSLLSDIKKVTYGSRSFPTLLNEIPDAPTFLYICGKTQPENVHLTVVGSRKFTPYGKQVTEAVVQNLSGLPVTIVSGLALGIDSIAHRAALASGVHTMAVPGSGLDTSVLYPKSHLSLAREIIAAGGALMSEFEHTAPAYKGTFARRNRIMAGLSHATLIIEAKEKSGTLITARLACDYNRDVIAAPGSIFSPNSVGPHALIRDGAIPLSDPAEIIDILGLQRKPVSHAELENSVQEVYELLSEVETIDEISHKLRTPPAEINHVITRLELLGLVQKIDGKICKK